MGNGRSAGHDVGVEAIVGIAWKLEEARRPRDQRIEALSRSIVGEARSINVPREGDDRLQFPAELERKFGSDLVGAISDRRDEPELGRPGSEAVVLALEQRPPRIFELLQGLTNALPQPLDVTLRQHLGAMAGDADGEDEGNRRRGANRRGDFRKRCVQSFSFATSKGPGR